jgi:hypothetical protein
MKFRDPFACRCISCGTETTFPVRQLLALTAHCPSCGASLNEIGLRMRRSVDEVAIFSSALPIIMHVEKHLGITITDESAEEVCARNELTLTDLASLVRRASPSVSPTLADEAIVSAVRSEFPRAPESPDFTAPLLDAISKQPHYGGY